MAKLRRLRTVEIVSSLERHGFEYDQHNGSHIIMERRSDGDWLSVPDRGNKPLPVGTISAVVRETGILRREFE